MKFQRGFTLIELISVMVIIGVLSVVAVGKLSSSTFSQRAFYDKVMANIEFARKSGVAQRRSVCVTTASNIITFKYDTRTPETSSATFCDGSSVSNLTLAQADSNCAGTTNQVCAPSGVALTGTASVVFDATGSNTGTAATYNATGFPASITVEAITGYVH